MKIPVVVIPTDRGKTYYGYDAGILTIHLETGKCTEWERDELLMQAERMFSNIDDTVPRSLYIYSVDQSVDPGYNVTYQLGPLVITEVGTKGLDYQATVDQCYAVRDRMLAHLESLQVPVESDQDDCLSIGA